jgi:hypothetical protein
MSDHNFPRDFHDAMKRHWQDAELLISQQPKRLANADHLYGLAAECGLKALMEKADEPLDIDNNQTHREKYKKHINATWAHYEDFRNGRLATYALGSTNPFTNWVIDQRYAAEPHFDHDRVERHRLGARAVYDLVAKAEDDGLLP